MTGDSPRLRSSPLAIVADLLRAICLIASVATIVAGLPLHAAGFLGVFLSALVVRFLRVPWGFDAAFTASLFLAVLNGALGWYEEIKWTDLVVHFLTGGTSAIVLYLLLSRYGLVHDLDDQRSRRCGARIVLLAATFSINIGVVWEFLEWIVYVIVPEAVLVGYEDTIGDLAAHALGGIAAGIVLSKWVDGADSTTRRRLPR